MRDDYLSFTDRWYACHHRPFIYSKQNGTQTLGISPAQRATDGPGFRARKRGKGVVARAEIKTGQIVLPRTKRMGLTPVLGFEALFGALAQPWVATAVALLVYLLRSAWGTRLARSDDAYFNYLADAFLHGQTYLREAPPHTLDLVYYGDRVYLYWPPFPAVLIAPLVALFGVVVSDRLYTAVIAALAIGLLARLLAVSIWRASRRLMRHGGGFWWWASRSARSC